VSPEPTHVPPITSRFDATSVLGGRNLAIGLMGLSLAYQGDFRGVGTVLLCLVIPGTLDSVIIWRKGVKSAAYGHIVGTMVFVVLGVYFVFGGGV
jgi:hypothetical protein